MEHAEIPLRYVNMELQREAWVGYMHLRVISIYTVTSIMGVDEVKWRETESKTRIESRIETQGKKTFMGRQGRGDP